MARLVAIEGIDGSGKGTQAADLNRRLTAEGYRSELISFPRYENTFFGRAVGDFLNGRFGSLDEVHPFLAAVLYAGDRFESRELLNSALSHNDVVVLDRYVASNAAHQGAKRSGEQRRELLARIEHLEHQTYQLPRADMTFLLDLPIDVAQHRIAQKSARAYTDRKADMHEADAGYLQSVRDAYLELAENQSSWIKIDCASEGSEKTVEDIHQEICEHVLTTIRT